MASDLEDLSKYVLKFKYADNDWKELANNMIYHYDDSVDCVRFFSDKWLEKPETKEEKEMNKVLELWYDRKRNKIIEKYDDLEWEFRNNHYGSVASFNELVEKFNNDLEELYKFDKATEQFALKENAPSNVIKYCVDNDKIKEEFEHEYFSQRNEELKELEELKEEVDAQLSLSKDLEYQQDVLKRYGIIDRRTNKMRE